MAFIVISAIEISFEVPTYDFDCDRRSGVSRQHAANATQSKLISFPNMYTGIRSAVFGACLQVVTLLSPPLLVRWFATFVDVTCERPLCSLMHDASCI